MPKVKRSLYQCLNAKVMEDRIHCSKGHALSVMSSDGTVATTKLMRGEPLELTVCQNCPDYDEMGPPVPKNERGWVGMEAKGG
jgi:protein-arginine kinase activator protein McsA